MKASFLAACLGMAAALAACQTMPAAETPARLTAPGAACIAQMAEFAGAQTGRPVTLTDRAFADSDVLLLERPLLRGPDGRPLDGRSLDRPQAFHLLKNGERCVMRHDASGARKVLDACTCAAP
jgi:hypothetical protein